MKVQFEKITSYCGIKCEECEFFTEGKCKGCKATKGIPFHRADGTTCELAACCISKNKRYCADCADIPCEKLKSFSNDPEHGDNPPGARIENLGKIKQELLSQAREGINLMSVCGFHCGRENCFLGQWCGGCRSEYNCCSFATLYPDGKCPNVTCCEEKGLIGCWECSELETCSKGFYGNTAEMGAVYLSKACAYFVKKFGVESFEKMHSYVVIKKKKRFDQYLTDFSSTEVLLKGMTDLYYEAVG